MERASRQCNLQPDEAAAGRACEKTGSADEAVPGLRGGHEPSAQPKVEKTGQV